MINSATMDFEQEALDRLGELDVSHEQKAYDSVINSIISRVDGTSVTEQLVLTIHILRDAGIGLYGTRSEKAFKTLEGFIFDNLDESNPVESKFEHLLHFIAINLLDDSQRLSWLQELSENSGKNEMLSEFIDGEYESITMTEGGVPNRARALGHG